MVKMAILISAMIWLLTGCGGMTVNQNTINTSEHERIEKEITEKEITGIERTEIERTEKETTAATEQYKNTYQQIDQDTAKKMMDEQEVLILDVREQEEYDSGHIKGAVLLPVGTINEETAKNVIPEKDDIVLVYCRSGNRSKTAAAVLAELGYTQIYEFGGINTWKYEKE